ncbi:MAG: hypothetical protein K6B45_04855 [Bacteroidaceae bacterium]|nr:hypothetical protein [Bacteroidaceae bacterium]
MGTSTYTLRYLDADGIYRSLILNGRSLYIGDDEGGAAADSYDALSDSLQENSLRTPIRPELVVVSSWLDLPNLMNIVDMALSSDVTLLAWRGHNVKVIPSAEDVLLQLSTSSPQSLKLRLRFASADSYTSSFPVSVPSDYRIHTAVFAAQFN